MRALLAWFQYRGWSNRYWREDWAMAICSHTAIGQTYPWEFGWGLYWDRVCLDCGKTIENCHDVQEH